MKDGKFTHALTAEEVNVKFQLAKSLREKTSKNELCITQGNFSSFILHHLPSTSAHFSSLSFSHERSICAEEIKE